MGIISDNDKELDEQFTVICFENEKGEDEHFAVVDSTEYGGATYCALVAYDIKTDDFIDAGEDEDAQEFYIVKEIFNGDEASYTEIDDDELNNKLAEIFSERLEELFIDGAND